MDKLKRPPWEALRSDITEDDAHLIETFEHDNAYFEAGMYPVPDGIGSVAIVFWGKAAADKTATYALFGRNRTNGPIEEIASGVVTTGSRLITKEPISLTVETAYWCDIITNTIEWMKTAVIKNVGNNGICYLCVDVTALKDLYCQFTDVNDGEGKMTEINAIILPMWSEKLEV